MAINHIFFVALQSCLLLGLIHGINPCGHSWLVLAPFVIGESNGKKVFSLTSAFIIGTSLACLAIGLSLGALSMSLPEHIRPITDMITSSVLVILGLILIFKPELLHNHSHNHGHDHGHDHHCACDEHDHDHAHEHRPDGEHDTHDRCDCGHHSHDHMDDQHHDGHDHDDHDHDDCREQHGCGCQHGPRLKKVTFWGLFAFGFMNMIVPCPTVAIMYSYALDSGSMFKSTAVFASYALGTGIALAGVIYAIYKVANAMRALNRPWLEPLIMRIAGAMTIAFGIYSYLADTGSV